MPSSNIPTKLRKIVPLAGLCVLMAMTSACSYVSAVTDKVTGNTERLVPDTGMVPLGARRAPVLNPGGALFNANAGLEEQKIAAENPYLNEGYKAANGATSASSKAAYYGENTPPPNQQAGNWKGNVFYGSDSNASGRRMPGENQADMMQPPTVMAAPVEPMGAPMPAPAMAPVTVPPLAAMPPSPAPSGLARDGYPDLAATPPAPAMANNYQSNMNTLVAERELAENMRREMMQNPEMAAEPGAPVPPAKPSYAQQPAYAQQPKSDSEFGGWVKKMFSEDDNKAAANQMATRADDVRRPIASAYVPPSPASPEPQMQAGLEPIVLTPPPSAEPMPPMAAPMQMASAAPVGAPPMEPITLSPPPPVMGDRGTMGLDASAEPISLQPPTMAMGARSTRFLPDGRYSSRRGASRMAMAR